MGRGKGGGKKTPWSQILHWAWETSKTIYATIHDVWVIVQNVISKVEKSIIFKLLKLYDFFYTLFKNFKAWVHKQLHRLGLDFQFLKDWVDAALDEIWDRVEKQFRKVAGYIHDLFDKARAEIYRVRDKVLGKIHQEIAKVDAKLSQKLGVFWKITRKALYKQWQRTEVNEKWIKAISKTIGVLNPFSWFEGLERHPQDLGYIQTTEAEIPEKDIEIVVQIDEELASIKKANNGVYDAEFTAIEEEFREIKRVMFPGRVV